MEKKKKDKRARKRPERKVFLWEFFVEKLLENVDECVMVSDSRGRVVFANQKFLSLTGLSNKRISGKRWMSLFIPAGKRAAVEKVFRKIKRKKKLTLFDAPLDGAGGEHLYVCWASVPLKRGRAFLYMFIGREGKRPCGKTVRVHSPSAKKIKSSYRDIVESLFAASMISEPQTAEHAARVMLFAVLLARKLKLGRESVERLKAAALLHDLGKLMVDEKILFKKGRLTSVEYAEIKKHPHWGAEVVRLVYFLHDIVPIMSNHHENYNGSGYPSGKKGKRIPIESRILSVADIYEALTADRPYRKGYSKTEAVKIMRGEKGRKLDPDITDLFIKMLKKGEFKWEDF